MKKFRQLKIPVAYSEQGFIFFHCQRYRLLSRRERERILALCRRIGSGDEHKTLALIELMTTADSWREICRRHYLSDSTLDRLRRRFYEEWSDYDG